MRVGLSRGDDVDERENTTAYRRLGGLVVRDEFVPRERGDIFLNLHTTTGRSVSSVTYCQR